MRKALAIIAVFAIIAGFGMVHSPSILVERISIGLMGFGTGYLIYLLIVTRPKRSQTKE
jgi:hypothetical protein